MAGNTIYLNWGKIVVAIDLEEQKKLKDYIRSMAIVVEDALDKVLELKDLESVKSAIDDLYDGAKGIFIRLCNVKDKELWMEYTMYDKSTSDIRPVTKKVKLLDYKQV